ncbi:MAG: FAD-dependent oxidoreductase, partial [Paracoccaceae bacterium]
HTPDVSQGGTYLLPPIIYPDGKTYLKIGGDPRDSDLKNTAEITDWFQGQGWPAGRDHLIAVINALMPELRYTDIKTAACVTTLTPSGMPVIQYQSARIIALTGGNGGAAKSSDEIGRLGAVIAQGGMLSGESYTSDFSAG